MLLLGIAIAGLVFGLFSLLLIVMFKQRYANELDAQLQQFKDSSEQIDIYVAKSLSYELGY